MKVTPVDLRDLDVTVSDLVRSPGLHASEIYNDLYAEIYPDKYGGDRKDLALFGSLGTAWEERLQYILIKSGMQVMRPGELPALGGKWVLSPDGVMFNGHDSIVEYKLRWASSRGASPRDPKKFGKYLIQLQDGCNAIESPYARIYVCYIAGDYRPPKPVLLAWDLEFSPRELKEAFDTMCSHAKHKGML